MSQLVRLEGKHTTQNAHCAVWYEWMDHTLVATAMTAIATFVKMRSRRSLNNCSTPYTFDNHKTTTRAPCCGAKTLVLHLFMHSGDHNPDYKANFFQLFVRCE